MLSCTTKLSFTPRKKPTKRECVSMVTAWVTLLDRSRLPAIRGAVVASVGYVSNWWLIAQHSSYFAQFGPASPLGHLWSLAVEEQFYLIWPWLLWIGLLWRRRHAGTDTRMAAARFAIHQFRIADANKKERPNRPPSSNLQARDLQELYVLACQPLGPLTTLNWTAWPSCKLRKPFDWIAE